MKRTPISTATPDLIASSTLTVATHGEGFTDITGEVQRFAAEAGAGEGSITLHIRHTSASLTIQENADPDVLADLLTAFQRLAPQGGGWRHTSEGADDMPAHIRTMLTATSLAVPLQNGRLALGTWQAIYLVEHRTAPHRRDVVLQFVGKRAEAVRL
jgi:secondary thiamine-phosphate synthase enzyme